MQPSDFSDLPLQARLASFGAAPRRWPLELRRLRFLPQGAFQGVWLWLIWQQNLARRGPARRKRIDSLWQLAEQKLGPLPEPHAEAEAAVPCELALCLAGDYYQAHGRLDYWEGWLRSYYVPTAVLGHLCRLIPQAPGWKPATRRALLQLAIRFLEPMPSPVTHLACLGELAGAAAALKCRTQAELLLDEMALLLSRLPGEELPARSLELGLEWLAHGQARQARFALRLWQQALRELAPDTQLSECERVLNLVPGALAGSLSLEAFSLLHGWLQRVGAQLLQAGPQPEARQALLRLYRLGLRLDLPESARWQAALGLAPDAPLRAAAFAAYALACEPWCAGLDEALALARQAVAALPAWLGRLGRSGTQPLYTAALSLPHGLAPAIQVLSLHLQTATLLLKQARGSSLRGRRERLIAWGKLLWAELLQALRADPELCDRLAEALLDWIKALAAAAADLSGLDAEIAGLPAGWGRWRLLLALAQACEPETAPWQRLLADWHGLDAFDQLQAIPALSLALAAAGPGARVWFEPLYELAAGVELPWRHGAVAAVAQGCLRAGELERALTLYGRIGEPSEQLRALLEALGLVSGPQAAADPILVSALLASVGRQTLPVLAWQAHLAAAMALRRRGEPEAALAAWAEGLIHLL